MITHGAPKATASLEDHAVRLDRLAVSVMKLRTEASDAVQGTRQAVDTIAKHNDEHKQAIMMQGEEAKRQNGQLDNTLRAHVVEEANTTRARMDALTTRIEGIAQAAATANTTVGLEVRMQQLEIAAKRLEEHRNVGIATVGQTIQAAKSEAQGLFQELRSTMMNMGTQLSQVMQSIASVQAAGGVSPNVAKPPGFGAEFGADFSKSGAASSNGANGFPCGGGFTGATKSTTPPFASQAQSAPHMRGAQFFPMSGDYHEGSSQQPKFLYDDQVAAHPLQPVLGLIVVVLVGWRLGYLLVVEEFRL